MLFNVTKSTILQYFAYMYLYVRLRLVTFVVFVLIRIFPYNLFLKASTSLASAYPYEINLFGPYRSLDSTAYPTHK